MIPAVRSWTREEMMKRVAFFKDLQTFGSRHPGRIKSLMLANAFRGSGAATSAVLDPQAAVLWTATR